MKFVGTRYCRVATGTPIRSAPGAGEALRRGGVEARERDRRALVEAGAGVGAEALERAAGLDLHAAQPAGAGEQLGVDAVGGDAEVGQAPAALGADLGERGGEVVLADERAGAEALRRGLRLDGVGDDLRGARRAAGLDVDGVDEPDDRGREAAEDREQDDERDQAASAGAPLPHADARRAGRGARGRGLGEDAAELGGERGALGVGGGGVAGRAGGVLARVLGALGLRRRRRRRRPAGGRPRPARPPATWPRRARCASPRRTRPAPASGSRRGPAGCPHRSPARTRRTSARGDPTGRRAPRQPSAVRTRSISSSASVRGSSRRRPSWMRPTIGGSLARRRAASSSGWPCTATTGPGSSSSGSAPPPTLATPSTTSPMPSCEPLGPGAEGGVVGGEHLEHGDVSVAVVEAQRGLERGERELVEPQRAGERVLLGGVDRGARADHHAGLRAAEQFVPGETHERGAGPDRAPHGRLVGEHFDVLGEVAGADVVDHRHAELAQLLDLDLLHEAELAEVRRVGAEDRAGVLGQRVGVVRPAGAIGGPDLDEPRAGLADDVRDAEAATDLDELAARDHDLLAGAGQRGGGEQHRGGAVVDGERGLGAGQLGEEVLDVGVARAAGAGLGVPLEVGVALRRLA